MIDEDKRDKSDHPPASASDVPSEAPTAAEGEPPCKSGEEGDGLNQGDFIDYLNEHFCGFNGS